MAFIAETPPARAQGELKQAYAMVERSVAGATNTHLIRALSASPAAMQRLVRRWELTMWVGDVPRAERELAASLTSRLLGCSY